MTNPDHEPIPSREKEDLATARGAAEAEAEATESQPGELTETQLEALLFVAERPLGRSEIAHLAGVDRETVDARVGDLGVSQAGRGIRLVESGDRQELATSSAIASGSSPSRVRSARSRAPIASASIVVSRSTQTQS